MFLENRIDKTVCTNPNMPGKPQIIQVDTSCPSHCIKDLPIKFEDFTIEKSTKILPLRLSVIINHQL